MVLGLVELSIDTFHACLEHVTFHQGEEMMGLLLGQSRDVGEGMTVIRFHAPIVLKRKDKRPDRVEISTEDLSLGMNLADDLDRRINAVPEKGDRRQHDDKVRILGWYHSHPKITVWPSHVDLGTHENYQMLDSDFVGLIFATYLTEGSADTGSSHKNELVAFQSVRDADTNQLERKVVPVKIVASNPKALPFILNQRKAVPEMLMQEEDAAIQGADTSLRSAAIGSFSSRQGVERIVGVATNNLNAILDHVMLPLHNRLKREVDHPPSSRINPCEAPVGNEHQNHGDASSPSATPSDHQDTEEPLVENAAKAPGSDESEDGRECKSSDAEVEQATGAGGETSGVFRRSEIDIDFYTDDQDED